MEWLVEQMPDGHSQFTLLSGTYKGADTIRDALRGWTIPHGAPDELAARDLPTLRRRSADLTRNNPLAAGAIATKVQGVVGTGLKLNAAIDRDLPGLDDGPGRPRPRPCGTSGPCPRTATSDAS